jgi:hypothetical protein
MLDARSKIQVQLFNYSEYSFALLFLNRLSLFASIEY